MSTNAQPRVLGRWCRTSRWCTLVHARRAFVAPADATSASCDVRSRDDSGRQRPRIAPSADRDDCVAWRQLTATSSAATSASGATSASRNVRGAHRQRATTSSAQRQARNVKCATWARRYVKRARSSAQRGRGATSSAQTSA